MNEEIHSKIAHKIEKIYDKYKDYPDELKDILESFVEELDLDELEREDLKE